ncbi:MAG: glycosyltransferase [Deltaproteobacteria bacterium]|jgi:glycosyltransferase involved in cell wall biosynthesis|nr:glycosyltransferase [Deltaproteobacteria bacterium]
MLEYRLPEWVRDLLEQPELGLEGVAREELAMLHTAVWQSRQWLVKNYDLYSPEGRLACLGAFLLWVQPELTEYSLPQWAREKLALPAPGFAEADSFGLTLLQEAVWRSEPWLRENFDLYTPEGRLGYQGYFICKFQPRLTEYPLSGWAEARLSQPAPSFENSAADGLTLFQEVIWRGNRWLTDNFDLKNRNSRAAFIKGSELFCCRSLPLHTLRIAVHGFSPQDAVGNFVQAIVNKAKNLGFPCAVYAQHHTPPLTVDGGYAELERELSPHDTLLYHLTWGDPDFPRLMRLPCRKIVYYHNITPGEFFLPDYPQLAGEQAKGRSMLKELVQADEVFANSAWSLEDTLPFLSPSAQSGVMPPITLNLLERLNGRAHPALKTPPVPYLVTLGRVAPHKNILGDIELFSAVHKLYPTLSYVILGNQEGFPDYLEKIQNCLSAYKEASRRVIFTGKVDEAEAAEWLRNAAGFLCVSRHEGFGAPLAEAMHLGVPVFALEQPAVKETLGNAGMLLDGNDLLRNAAAVAAALKSTDTLASMKDTGKKRAAQLISQAEYNQFWASLMPSVREDETRATPARVRPRKAANETAIPRAIVLLCRNFTQTGGIPTFTRDLAEALAKLGRSTHVLIEGDAQRTWAYEQNSFQVHELPAGNQPLSVAASKNRVPGKLWSWSAAALAECRRIHKSEPVQVVEAPIWNCEGIAFLLHGSWPLVTSLHTTLFSVLKSDLAELFDKTWMSYHVAPMLQLERELMLASDAVRANSRGVIAAIESDYALAFNPARIMVIPHGLRTLPVQAEQIGDGGKVNILFVGRFEARKGIDLLLEVLPGLLETYPRVSFTLAGEHNQEGGRLLGEADDTPYAEAFLEKYRGAPWLSRVHFPGKIPDDELLAAYDNCDLFCGPSRFESFGLIFLEAMRAGKAVIACNTGGMPEIVTPGENGLLIPPGNAQALAEALAWMIERPEDRKRMGQTGRRIFEERFTAGRMAEKSLELYTLALSQFSKI